MYINVSVVISHMLEIDDNIPIVFLYGCRLAVNS